MSKPTFCIFGIVLVLVTTGISAHHSHPKSVTTSQLRQRKVSPVLPSSQKTVAKSNKAKKRVASKHGIQHKPSRKTPIPSPQKAAIKKDPKIRSSQTATSSQPSSMEQGDVVTVIGTMATINGERVLIVDQVQTENKAEIKPMMITTKDMGGGQFGLQQPVMEYRNVKQGNAYAKILAPATGLNNIGILVKIAGKVTAIGYDSSHQWGYFYVDDGCKCDDGSGNIGVRVWSFSFDKPHIGDMVTVVGVSSTYQERGSLWRALVMPEQSSLTVQ